MSEVTTKIGADAMVENCLGVDWKLGLDTV
jgi:hypothetical protein